MSQITYVIGHRNPDADSICSAIAYAEFKQQRGEESYVAARCGNSNARIDAILHRFNHPLPLFLGDVSPRVRDIMVRDVVKIHLGQTCARALELIDHHDIRLLPVVSEEGKISGHISVFDLGDYFIPKVREPRSMRRVETCLSAIVEALQARSLVLNNEHAVEELYVKIGAMDIRSFGKFSESENIPPEHTIIVVGDRWDIHQKSIQTGVRLLVITGNLEIDPEAVELARQKGVSVIVSPYDSATTAWIIRSASIIDRMVRKDLVTFSPEERLSEVRRKVAASASALAYMVVDDAGRLLGLFTKTNILRPVDTRLVLVDHNEMSQAVPGAPEVTISEIIDHHRLGALHTQQPILFINEPVGSTCTIVADLFRRDNLRPDPAIAGIMMSGIISDTLNLQSPTSTPKDQSILTWLADIAGVEPNALADLIFSSGSIILAQSPAEVIRSDFKVYEEEKFRFSVSQVEELGYTNFWNHAPSLAQALEQLVRSEGLYFSALLVTDINSQNSILLIKGSAEFIDRISYQPIEKGTIYDLPGIVSRKKQLLPFITSILASIRVGAPAGEA
ncbi:MAG: putative manganese-dependent inorganic diphosphatase [Puniceicoccaceae bacterium]|nr:MAG: putative manganese-dependent inorganic diphosphatase [Puniceicoccaceae bacterium]